MIWCGWHLTSSSQKINRKNYEAKESVFFIQYLASKLLKTFKEIFSCSEILIPSLDLMVLVKPGQVNGLLPQLGTTWLKIRE